MTHHPSCPARHDRRAACCGDVPMTTDPQARAVILCGTDNAQPGTQPYFIGYVDLVDGYRHAWTEADRFGRSKIRRGRNRVHPADPRCPGCIEEDSCGCGRRG